MDNTFLLNFRNIYKFYLGLIVIFQKINIFLGNPTTTSSTYWEQYQIERFKNILQWNDTKVPMKYTLKENIIFPTPTEKHLFMKRNYKEQFIVGKNKQILNIIKSPSIQDFLNFLQFVQTTWLENLHIDSRINTLTNLKNQLIFIIQDQIAITLQQKFMLRSKRGIFEESYINFPTEAALMSINFLTFAVFLIKLVLQVVHIIKSKHYNLTTVGVNTSTAMKTKVYV